MSTGTTLYYPFIHPRDGNYLKSALVYWDRVRRIVPNSVMHGDHVMDDDPDAEMLTDRKLLVTTRPEPYEEAAAERFFEHVEPHADRFQIDVKTAKAMADRNRGFHVEKFGYGVINRLHERGLAHKFGDWVTMHDEVGAFYMFCLASEMADKMSVPLYTDSSNDADMGQALLFTPQANDPVSDILVRLGIGVPSPDQLKDIPMKHIADFAEQRCAEKQAFRDAIEGVASAAGAYEDPNAMDDYLAGQRKQIENAVGDLRKTIDELRVGAISGVAKITIPAGAAAAIAALPISHEAAAILGVLGIIVSGVSCFAETRGKLRQARAASPYHYLIALEDNLGL